MVDLAEAGFSSSSTLSIDARGHPRFGAMNVIASMQPYHTIDDGRWAEQYVGNRIETMYAYRDLLDQRRGSRSVATGVAPPTPLDGIYGAVTAPHARRQKSRRLGAASKDLRRGSMRAYTADAAYASFDEMSKGTLAQGYLAISSCSTAICSKIPPEQIRDAKVDLTVVGGRVVYERAAN